MAEALRNKVGSPIRITTEDTEIQQPSTEDTEHSNELKRKKLCDLSDNLLDSLRDLCGEIGAGAVIEKCN